MERLEAENSLIRQEPQEEETGLSNSDIPLDDATKASLAAMFGDDD